MKTVLKTSPDFYQGGSEGAGARWGESSCIGREDRQGNRVINGRTNKSHIDQSIGFQSGAVPFGPEMCCFRLTAVCGQCIVCNNLFRQENDGKNINSIWMDDGGFSQMVIHFGFGGRRVGRCCEEPFRVRWVWLLERKFCSLNKVLLHLVAYFGMRDAGKNADDSEGFTNYKKKRNNQKLPMILHQTWSTAFNKLKISVRFLPLSLVQRKPNKTDQNK